MCAAARPSPAVGPRAARGRPRVGCAPGLRLPRCGRRLRRCARRPGHPSASVSDRVPAPDERQVTRAGSRQHMRPRLLAREPSPADGLAGGLLGHCGVRVVRSRSSAALLSGSPAGAWLSRGPVARSGAAGEATSVDLRFHTPLDGAPACAWSGVRARSAVAGQLPSPHAPRPSRREGVSGTGYATPGPRAP